MSDKRTPLHEQLTRLADWLDTEADGWEAEGYVEVAEDYRTMVAQVLTIAERVKGKVVVKPAVGRVWTYEMNTLAYGYKAFLPTRIGPAEATPDEAVANLQETMDWSEGD